MTLTMMRLAAPHSSCSLIITWLAAAVLVAAAGAFAAADDQAATGTPAVQQPAEPAIPPQPAPSPAAKPGFLYQLKVWWDDSVSYFGAKIKDTRGGVDDLNKKSAEAAKSVAATAEDAMRGALDASKGAAAATQGAMQGALEAGKGAAGTVMRLPNTRVVDVRERCETAPNGAPDCAAAAAAACRGKGFATGKPLDVVTAAKCDTRQAAQAVQQQGQLPSKGDCPVESVITRAVCQ